MIKFNLQFFADNETFGITTDLTKCVGDAQNPTTIETSGEATLKFTANTKYNFNNADILISGAKYEMTISQNRKELTVVLSEPDDEVVIEITVKNLEFTPEITYFYVNNQLFACFSGRKAAKWDERWKMTQNI